MKKRRGDFEIDFGLYMLKTREGMTGKYAVEYVGTVEYSRPS